jgi:hypothetical protein
MGRTKSSSKLMRKCGKATGKAGSRIRRCGKRAVALGRRNDGANSAKPNPWRIPPCTCGVTKFALVGSDGGKYFAVQCESCRKQSVFRVRGRKLTMLRQID